MIYGIRQKLPLYKNTGVFWLIVGDKRMAMPKIVQDR
jgi:hypothetical protein